MNPRIVFETREGVTLSNRDYDSSVFIPRIGDCVSLPCRRRMHVVGVLAVYDLYYVTCIRVVCVENDAWEEFNEHEEETKKYDHPTGL
jgi:hypothetical protein